MEQEGKGEICAGQCQLYQLFLAENDDEEAFLHKPIVPQDPDIATQSGSFVNSFPMFHW
ncbi:MAG: hypothetical protein ACRDDF_07445 [Aeromonas sp.]